MHKVCTRIPLSKKCFVLAQLSETARKFSWNVMYAFKHQHRNNKRQKETSLQRHTQRHNYTQAGARLGTHNSTGALSCLHVPVCSVTLPAHLSAMLFGLRSIWCLTYNKFPPVRLSMLFFPLSAHLSVLFCRSISISMPQTVSHIKGTFLSALQIEKPHYISLFVLSAGDKSKSGSFPLFYHSFIPLFASSTSVSSIFPHFLPSFPLYLKNKSLCTSLPASHLSDSSLPSPCLYCPPTACSHSHSEYVSRKYYHTKWKGEFFFLSSLFFSFNIALPSLSPCLLISWGTGVWQLKEERKRSFSSSYKRFWWRSIICTQYSQQKKEKKNST